MTVLPESVEEGVPGVHFCSVLPLLLDFLCLKGLKRFVLASKESKAAVLDEEGRVRMRKIRIPFFKKADPHAIEDPELTLMSEFDKFQVANLQSLDTHIERLPSWDLSKLRVLKLECSVFDLPRVKDCGNLECVELGFREGGSLSEVVLQGLSESLWLSSAEDIQLDVCMADVVEALNFVRCVLKLLKERNSPARKVAFEFRYECDFFNSPSPIVTGCEVCMGTKTLDLTSEIHPVVIESAGSLFSILEENKLSVGRIETRIVGLRYLPRLIELALRMKAQSLRCMETHLKWAFSVRVVGISVVLEVLRIFSWCPSSYRCNRASLLSIFESAAASGVLVPPLDAEATLAGLKKSDLDKLLQFSRPEEGEGEAPLRLVELREELKRVEDLKPNESREEGMGETSCLFELKFMPFDS